MAWSGFISESERLDAVLKYVGEDEQAVFAGQDLAEDLQAVELDVVFSYGRDSISLNRF